MSVVAKSASDPVPFHPKEIITGPNGEKATRVDLIRETVELFGPGGRIKVNKEDVPLYEAQGYKLKSAEIPTATTGIETTEGPRTADAATNPAAVSTQPYDFSKSNVTQLRIWLTRAGLSKADIDRLGSRDAYIAKLDELKFDPTQGEE